MNPRYRRRVIVEVVIAYIVAVVVSVAVFVALILFANRALEKDAVVALVVAVGGVIGASVKAFVVVIDKIAPGDDEDD